MRQEEHNLQCACVKWFALQYPEYRGLLFAVPNGGNRNTVTAAKLKAEGVVPGVADLILLVPRIEQGCNNMYHALCIEMKIAKGRQRPEQKAWQAKAECFGYKYAVCRSLEDFINTIENYLNP